MDLNMKQYMVVERFKDGCWERAYARLHAEGRMLPEGLNYLNSWANREKQICYPLMETSDPGLFNLWFSRWIDLVEFELIPIDQGQTPLV